MLDQREHTETTTTVTLLSALLADPDFKLGIEAASETFLEIYEPMPLTRDEMISEVETELRRKVVEHDHLTPYLFSLGHVIGTIAQGLSYAGAHSAKETQPC